MTRYRKIDEVLIWLALPDNLGVERNQMDILNALIKKYPSLNTGKLFTDDLIKIINKLHRDGYITAELRHTVNAHTMPSEYDEYVYELTFEGVLFIENGGYDKQLEKENMAIRNSKATLLFAALSAMGAITLAFVETLKLLRGSP